MSLKSSGIAWTKLQLNDASLTFELETSQALGLDFVAVFWACCTWKIIQERLEREFDQTVITTVPNVSFIAYTTNGQKIIVNNPTEMPIPCVLNALKNPLYVRRLLPSRIISATLLPFAWASAVSC